MKPQHIAQLTPAEFDDLELLDTHGRVTADEMALRNDETVRVYQHRMRRLVKAGLVNLAPVHVGSKRMTYSISIDGHQRLSESLSELDERGRNSYSVARAALTASMLGAAAQITLEVAP